MPDWLAGMAALTQDQEQTSAYTIDLAPGSYTIFSFGEDAEGVPDAAKGMTATARCHRSR